MSLIVVVCMIVIGTIFIGTIDCLVEKSKAEFKQAVNNHYKYIHSLFHNNE